METGYHMEASACYYVSCSLAQSAGAVSYVVEVPATANYYLWVRAMGLAWWQNSFYVSADGGEDIPFEIPPVGETWTWTWRKFGAQPFFLSAGQHVLRFKVREPNARLDVVLLTDSDLYVPSGAAPCAITPTFTPTPSPTATPTATPPPPLPTWTLMVYMAGDNNMYRAFDRAIADLEAAAIPTNVRVVVQYDGNLNNDTRRFEVQRGGQYRDGVNRWAIAETNTGSPAALAEFVIWARQNYPADYYYLAIADHGRGTTGVAWDETSRGDYLTPHELRSALATATQGGSWRIDVLHYDACLMAMLELAYDVPGYARYFVSYQNLGWSLLAYDRYAAVAGTYPATPRVVAAGIARAYHDHPRLENRPRNVSALDLDAVGEVTQKLDALSEALRAGLPAFKPAIASARAAVQKLDSQDFHRLSIEDEYIDLYHFASLIRQGVTNSTVQNAAQALMDALTGRFVVASYTASGYQGGVEGAGFYWDLDNCHGVSVYFPPDQSSSDYGAYIGHGIFAFTGASKWDNLLADYFATRGPAPTPREPPGMPALLEP